jgi:squalene-hopene/tetraprenyl-beta-curcumene cyclase
MKLRSFACFVGAIVVAGCGDATPSSSSSATPPAAKGPIAGAPDAAPTTRPDSPPPGTETWKDRAKAAADKGVRFLREKQSPEGLWGFRLQNGEFRPDVGLTGLALLSILESPRGYSESDGPFIRLPAEWLAAQQKPDGSIHGGMLATYNTAVAMLALSATKNPKYRPVLDKGLEYLRVVQSDESERYERSDVYYGGVGYGGDERPDLSNTHFAVEAAAKSGMAADDPFFEKALVFLQRSQNYGETNDLPVKDGVSVGNDGGGYYAPGASSGEAKAGFVELPDGRKIRRSYGSMSYALLKSYAFCKLDRRDARVRALVSWLDANYDVTKNPGMTGDKPNAEYAGLFYYYLTMARALQAAGDVLSTKEGTPRPWKRDLAEHLVALQKEDGAWTNDRNGEFWENVPVLATAYSVGTLAICLK